ncbi:hypothetical protein STCU_05187 [Strigomonas culicis]|uniref:IFT81 calponin homology domain-containing protein n=1 Tax=Strigomonas culicis TaxID=28005 RepID=S9VMG3_9TRYP|nr:hypothetical protein STCU_09345 [Strigomonas culicis]EPY28326.1 hypothetical protein STCU_05187 [Strigomonas culicis]|eukprot:EPY19662.1 hypothetical protein STCU_09345 [Strigomonas culicis]
MFNLTNAAAAAGAADGAKAESQAPAAEDLTPEELLQYVVEHVNSTLNRKYSLVDFDGLRGNKLLQVVNDIFATLLPSMQMDMETANKDEAMPRMIDFLTKTLGYRIPVLIQSSFPASFAAAEPTVVYPTMYWVLTHMQQNEKRVYLSRFLQPIEVPEDIRATDEDVRTIFGQYQQLRTSFVQIHKRVEALRAAFADPAETRRTVAALEEEKERLQQYVQAAEKKLANVPNKDALLEACKLLRLALEDDTKLSEKKVEQQQAKISIEMRNTEMSNRLQNLRRDAADGRVDIMVRRMKDEIQTNKIKLEEQLPLEIDAKQRENAELNKLLSEPLDMAALTSEERQLDDALRKLHDKVRDRQRPGEDGSSIATIKQQVQRVQGRKAEVLAELGSLQADNNRALTAIRERESRIEQLRQATNMLKGDDFREFSNQVRAKKAATEGMRTRLAEQRAEWGVLTYTQQALQERFDELDKIIGNLESKLGLQGYSRTVEALSKLTAEKDTIEEVKGKTLEELSRVVQDFTLAIREGRTRLAPLINELRTVRQTAAEVEEEWSDKKSQYDYQKGLLMEDIQKLDDDVTRLKEERNANESLFHRVRTQSVLLAAQVKRAAEERAFRSQPELSLDPQYKTYSDYFADVTKQLEARTKDLQTRRRDVDENHDTNVQQVDWFNSLRRILEGKLASLRDAAPPGSSAGRQANVDQAIKQVMGADMLVLNNN